MANDPTIQIEVGTVKVTLTGEVSSEQLESVLRGIRTQLPELMQAGSSRSTTPTLADLLARADARTFADKAGVAAYWLEALQGRADWRTGDVVDALRLANEAVPANMTDALNQKLKKGLFEVRDRRWRLTGEGRGWVKYRLLRDQDEDDPTLEAASGPERQRLVNA